jgi:hypothetical protein
MSGNQASRFAAFRARRWRFFAGLLLAFGLYRSTTSAIAFKTFGIMRSAPGMTAI